MKRNKNLNKNMTIQVNKNDKNEIPIDTYSLRSAYIDGWRAPVPIYGTEIYELIVFRFIF